MGQIQLNLILQEFIVAHPSGSSGGASKESRTFSFWRFATESENWDFLDMSTIVKVNDYDCRLSENYPPSLFTDVQLFTNAITITCKSPPQQGHWKCNTSRDQLGLFWKSRSSSPLVKVVWKTFGQKYLKTLLIKKKYLKTYKKLTSTPFHLHRFIVDFWSL